MDHVINRNGVTAKSMRNELSDEHIFRRESQKLLRAITCELCGEKEPGCQDFLETQLKRYYEFLMKYDEKAAQMRGLLPFQLRTHLLLSLQSDLIKLLVEVDCH